MEPAKYLLTYLLTVPVFFAIDMVWLGVVAKGLYQKELGKFLSEKPNWAAAIVFYLLYIVGIIILAVAPAVEKQSLLRAVFLGGVFGGLAYATYDLTNLATLKNWPIKIVIIDIIWGVILTASIAGISYTIANWLR
jgi:uncharacterized membrane protein